MSDELRRKRENARRACRRKFRLAHALCLQCCYVPATERHHADGDTANNTAMNVWLVCAPCHDSLHTGERYAWDRSPDRWHTAHAA